MDPAGIPALLDAIRHMHGCEAKHVRTEHVDERHGGETAWSGDVECFELAGHATATHAYAWSEPVRGTNRRRFFAVLVTPPVVDAVTAVRASIWADAERRGSS